MNRIHEETQQEIDKAWCLWNALFEYAQTLWDRYEPAFVDLIIQERDFDQVPPDLDQDPPDFPESELQDDDIPF